MGLWSNFSLAGLTLYGFDCCNCHQQFLDLQNSKSINSATTIISKRYIGYRLVTASTMVISLRMQKVRLSTSLRGICFAIFLFGDIRDISIGNCPDYSYHPTNDWVYSLQQVVFQGYIDYTSIYIYIYILSKEVWKLNFRQYGEMEMAQPGRNSDVEKVSR